MKKYKGNKIVSSIKEEALYLNIGKVLIALSGGADSIATAHALKEVGLEIIALHCNFHLRGDESDRDCRFVEEFCRVNDIQLKLKDFNVDEYMQSHPGESIEMACRKLRYDWFDKILKETGYQRIVTGHNADDNIETFLLNMLRGSGTRGLRGMSGDNGKIWRPLLKFHREEIITYLKDNNLSYVVDSTNLLSDYRRNFLRNEIIPQLKKEWKGFNTSMDKTISNLENENRLVEDIINKNLKEAARSLSGEQILSFPAPLLLIKRYIEPLGPFVTTPEEVMSSIKANKPHIKKWRLKKGNLILRNGCLFIEMGHSESST